MCVSTQATQTGTYLFCEICNDSESAFSCVTSRLHYRFKHFSSYTKSRSTHKEVVLLYVENPRARISFDYIIAVRTGIIAQIVLVFYFQFFAPKSFTLGPLGKLHPLFHITGYGHYELLSYYFSIIHHCRSVKMQSKSVMCDLHVFELLLFK